MSESISFSGAPVPGGANGRKRAGLALALVIAFVAVAIAKPWGSPTAPAPIAQATPASVPTQIAALPAPGAATPTMVASAPSPTTVPAPPSPTPPASAGPLPVSFTTPVAPADSAEWRGLRWRRLAADDPLTLVSSVSSWSGGFVAVGRNDQATPSVPIWTSTDGVRWDPIPFDSFNTISLGSRVIGVVTLPSEMVVVTQATGDCGALSCASAHEPGVVAWASADGRSWTPHSLPAPANPIGGALKFAGGPAGVVIASGGLGTPVILAATDGVSWQTHPQTTLPASFILNDVSSTDGGYVAVGLWVISDVRWDPASLWSVDGLHWSRKPTQLPTSSAPARDAESSVTSVVTGRHGVIAVGRNYNWPGGTLWWQSVDGQHWSAPADFAPLGATSCSARQCPREPDGWLVGGGQRFVAGRSGTVASAWVSFDGRAWQSMYMSGDVPGSAATQETLLPGGVLITDGVTTWFGEPVVS